MFCRQVFGNISGGISRYFAFWGEFLGISRKYLNFAGPRPREISEALNNYTNKLYCYPDNRTETNYFEYL